MTAMTTAHTRISFSNKMTMVAKVHVVATVVFLLVLVDLVPWAGTAGTVPPAYWDYIVVGAGPAGLQMGHFLQKANRDYVILERGNVSGNFFTSYPRHDLLISINKRNTGKTNKEFNLRHDWNSLISDDETLLYKHYSREFFPQRATMLDYLRDYKDRLGLHVMHDVDVRDIHRSHGDGNDADNIISMSDQRGNTFSCKTLIMATGLWKPNAPEFTGSEYTEGYEDVPIDAENFEGQSVLILGRGNAAFEVADRIYGSTNVIHMIGRSRVRLSWSTHYVGDLRAINNGLLDTYQLKSLDGVLEAPIEDVRLVKEGSKLFLALALDDGNTIDMFDNFALREGYDRVIRCLGFTFDDSVFRNASEISRPYGRASKYPSVHHDYESLDIPGLYMAGALSHSLDHRKSAGGFIHGYRYTVRSLHHILEMKNHGVTWPRSRAPLPQLVPTIIKRINEASGIYQMFSVLGDVIAIRRDTDEFEYFEEFPVNLLHDFKRYTGVDVTEVVVVLLEYGANFSGPGKDIFSLDRATGEPSQAHRSNFLHPVFYYYKNLPSEMDMLQRPSHQNLPRPDHVHHIVEDFLTSWDAPNSHVLPLRRFIENILNKDFRHHLVEDCFAMAMTHSDLPYMCEQHYLAGAGIVGTDPIATRATEAGLTFL